MLILMMLLTKDIWRFN